MSNLADMVFDVNTDLRNFNNTSNLIDSWYADIGDSILEIDNWMKDVSISLPQDYSEAMKVVTLDLGNLIKNASTSLNDQLASGIKEIQNATVKVPELQTVKIVNNAMPTLGKVIVADGISSIAKGTEISNAIKAVVNEKNEIASKLNNDVSGAIETDAKLIGNNLTTIEQLAMDTNNTMINTIQQLMTTITDRLSKQMDGVKTDIELQAILDLYNGENGLQNVVNNLLDKSQQQLLESIGLAIDDTTRVGETIKVIADKTGKLAEATKTTETETKFVPMSYNMSDIKKYGTLYSKLVSDGFVSNDELRTGLISTSKEINGKTVFEMYLDAQSKDSSIKLMPVQTEEKTTTTITTPVTEKTTSTENEKTKAQYEPVIFGITPATFDKKAQFSETKLGITSATFEPTGSFKNGEYYWATSTAEGLKVGKVLYDGYERTGVGERGTLVKGDVLNKLESEGKIDSNNWTVISEGTHLGEHYRLNEISDTGELLAHSVSAQTYGGEQRQSTTESITLTQTTSTGGVKTIQVSKQEVESNLNKYKEQGYDVSDIEKSIAETKIETTKVTPKTGELLNVLLTGTGTKFVDGQGLVNVATGKTLETVSAKELLTKPATYINAMSANAADIEDSPWWAPSVIWGQITQNTNQLMVDKGLLKETYVDKEIKEDDWSVLSGILSVWDWAVNGTPVDKIKTYTPTDEGVKYANTILLEAASNGISAFDNKGISSEGLANYVLENANPLVAAKVAQDNPNVVAYLGSWTLTSGNAALLFGSEAINNAKITAPLSNEQVNDVANRNLTAIGKMTVDTALTDNEVLNALLFIPLTVGIGGEELLSGSLKAIGALSDASKIYDSVSVIGKLDGLKSTLGDGAEILAGKGTLWGTQEALGTSESIAVALLGTSPTASATFIIPNDAIKILEPVGKAGYVEVVSKANLLDLPSMAAIVNGKTVMTDLDNVNALTKILNGDVSEALKYVPSSDENVEIANWLAVIGGKDTKDIESVLSIVTETNPKITALTPNTVLSTYEYTIKPEVTRIAEKNWETVILEDATNLADWEKAIPLGESTLSPTFSGEQLESVYKIPTYTIDVKRASYIADHDGSMILPKGLVDNSWGLNEGSVINLGTETTPELFKVTKLESTTLGDIRDSIAKNNAGFENTAEFARDWQTKNMGWSHDQEVYEIKLTTATENDANNAASITTPREYTDETITGRKTTLGLYEPTDVSNAAVSMEEYGVLREGKPVTISEETRQIWKDEASKVADKIRGAYIVEQNPDAAAKLIDENIDLLSMNKDAVASLFKDSGLQRMVTDRLDVYEAAIKQANKKAFSTVEATGQQVIAYIDKYGEIPKSMTRRLYDEDPDSYGLLLNSKKFQKAADKEPFWFVQSGIPVEDAYTGQIPTGITEVEITKIEKPTETTTKEITLIELPKGTETKSLLGTTESGRYAPPTEIPIDRTVATSKATEWENNLLTSDIYKALPEDERKTIDAALDYGMTGGQADTTELSKFNELLEKNEPAAKAAQFINDARMYGEKNYVTYYSFRDGVYSLYDGDFESAANVLGKLSSKESIKSFYFAKDASLAKMMNLDDVKMMRELGVNGAVCNALDTARVDYARTQLLVNGVDKQTMGKATMGYDLSLDEARTLWKPENKELSIDYMEGQSGKYLGEDYRAALQKGIDDAMTAGDNDAAGKLMQELDELATTLEKDLSDCIKKYGNKICSEA